LLSDGHIHRHRGRRVVLSQLPGLRHNLTASGVVISG
jgi:hypothetical protein